MTAAVILEGTLSVILESTPIVILEIFYRGSKYLFISENHPIIIPENNTTVIPENHSNVIPNLIGDPVFSFFFFVIFILCNSWNQLLRNPVFTSFFVFSDQSRNLFFFLFYSIRNTSWIPAIALNDREGGGNDRNMSRESKVTFILSVSEVSPYKSFLSFCAFLSSSKSFIEDPDQFFISIIKSRFSRSKIQIHSLKAVKMGVVSECLYREFMFPFWINLWIPHQVRNDIKKYFLDSRNRGNDK